MLKCIIIPLIIPSLIVAVGSLDMRISGKIGARGVFYYMSTTICAVILGIILVSAIQPGKGASPIEKSEPERNITTEDTLMDLVRNLFPPNIVQVRYLVTFWSQFGHFWVIFGSLLGNIWS